MSELIQSIVDGKIPTSTATTTTAEKSETKGTTNLGHDAFLQLLVCEMQHQDPLEPTTNTEWIAQLASFSQLEELQSLSKVTENSQLFSLVGKNVIVKAENAAGEETLKSGLVEFISLSGGTAKFSVDGALYSMTDLYSVVDEEYLYNKNKPSVPENKEFDFNGEEPEDLKFKVFMGEDSAKATEVAVLVGNSIIAPEYVILSDGEVTVKKEILQELEAGSYRFSVVFNDTKLTSADDKIQVNIYNTHPMGTEENPEAEEDTSAQANAEGTEVGNNGSDER